MCLSIMCPVQTGIPALTNQITRCHPIYQCNQSVALMFSWLITAVSSLVAKLSSNIIICGFAPLYRTGKTWDSSRTFNLYLMPSGSYYLDLVWFYLWFLRMRPSRNLSMINIISSMCQMKILLSWLDTHLLV